MVLEIVLAAVLIAFGIASIYFTIESKANDRKMIIVLLIGAAAIIGGAWIILTNVTLFVLLTKLAGLILAGIGVFLIFGFPDIMGEYQRESMSKAGVFFGIIFLIVGAYFLFFFTFKYL